jgi:arylsulfatase A-like enzyme
MDVVPTIASKAVDYIGKRQADKKPFFLYLALPSPHTPLVPTQAWQGKSGLGPYGDYVMETDWAVGEVLKAIDRGGLSDNTLVVLTSDNGCAPYIGVKELEALGHFPSAQFRGYKTQIWDGGHRIPFLVRWPAKVKADSQSDQIACLTDLMATCAEIIGAKLPDTAGEDSVSFLPALLGTDKAPLREAVVHHAFHGAFAIRQGHWKLALCQGGGGSAIGDDGDTTSPQLYDLSKDIAETTNEAQSHPEIVERLTKLLEQYVANGRSTPGGKQANDAEIQIEKKAD